MRFTFQVSLVSTLIVLLPVAPAEARSWVRMDSGTTNRLNAVWGTSESDIFAAGEAGTILHYDGRSWEPMQVDTEDEITHLFGTGSADVFAAVRHPAEEPQPEFSTVYHYDGSAWSPLASQPRRSPEDLRIITAMDGPPGGPLFAAVRSSGASAIFRYQDTWQEACFAVADRVEAFWMTSSDHLAAAYDGRVVQEDASEPCDLDDPPRWGNFWVGPYGYLPGGINRSGFVIDLWGPAPEDAFALTVSGVYRWGGERDAWTQIDDFRAGSAIWGTAADDIFVTGDLGATVRHWDGTEWTIMDTPEAGGLGAIWGLGGPTDDVFAVGRGGTILRLRRGSLVDVDLVGLEVIQAIQDWSLSVPLVADKPTLVRAFFTSAEGVPVEARLRGFDRFGTERPGSPLSPQNPSGFVYTGELMLLTRELDESLNFALPASWLEDTLTVEVEVNDSTDIDIHCGEAAGPSAGDCRGTVQFEEVPPIQIKFIPIDRADTAFSPASVRPQQIIEIARRLRAIYPVAEVDFSISPDELFWEHNLRRGENQNRLGAALMAIRAADGCGARCPRIYHGVYGQSDPGGFGWESGQYRVLSTSAFVDTQTYGRFNIAHEIGHNLGLPHTAECVDRPPAAPLPLQPNYSLVVEGIRVPTIGPMTGGDDLEIWGLDTSADMAVVSPYLNFEIMSYCGGSRWGPFRSQTTHRWISHISYRLIMSSIRGRFSSHKQDAPVRPILLVSGTIDGADDTAVFAPVLAFETDDPPAAPDPGEYALDLWDGRDVLLSTISLDPVGPQGEVFADEYLPFTVAIDGDLTVRSIVLRRGDVVLGSLVASASPPTVELVSPNGGEDLTGEVVTLDWTADDPDGDALTYTVWYSADSGDTWEVIAMHVEDTALELPRGGLAGTREGLLRVQASDGFNTATDDSDAPFSVANSPPVALIESPSDGALFAGGRPIDMRGIAYDREDGAGEVLLEWTSDLAGALGSGDAITISSTELVEGEHELRLVATDAAGDTAQDSVTVRVAREIPDELADLAVFLSDRPDPAAPGEVVTLHVAVVNHGPETASPAMLAVELPAGATLESISSEGEICVQAGGAVECPLSALARGQEAVWTIALEPAGEGLLATTARLPLLDSDPIHANNSASEQTLVVEPPLDSGGGGGDAGDTGGVGDGGVGAGGGGGGGGCGCHSAPRSADTRWGALLLFVLAMWRRGVRTSRR